MASSWKWKPRLIVYLTILVIVIAGTQAFRWYYGDDSVEKGLDRTLRVSLLGGTASPTSVRALLEAGANPNTEDDLGYTPLMWANAPIRLDVEDPDATGKIPKRVVFEICQILIQAGADANHRARNNCTPIGSAAANCNPETVKLFIERGANLDVPIENIGTPLVQAVFNGCPECAVVLIEAGADVNATGFGGKSVLELALQERDFQGTEALAMIERATTTHTSATAANDGP